MGWPFAPTVLHLVQTVWAIHTILQCPAVHAQLLVLDQHKYNATDSNQEHEHLGTSQESVCVRW